MAVLSLLLVLFAYPAPASISGTITDPTGARLKAVVALLRDGRQVDQRQTDDRGEFSIEGVAAGRYQVQAEAAGFEAATSEAIYVGASGNATVHLTLSIGPLRQELSVTASAIQAPLAQSGASVTVLDSDLIESAGRRSVIEALRAAPGTQILETGGRGGKTSMFIRGGSSDFNKVLLDGVPVNEIGGAFDFSSLAAAGVDRVELLRVPNSSQYGADGLAGVINVTTRRGETATPELEYSLDGGNLNAIRQTFSVGGLLKRFDYFGELAHLKTDNRTPNNAYQNGTFAGRLGYALTNSTDLSLVVRRTRDALDSPNAISLYGVPDDSSSFDIYTFVSASAQSHWTPRLNSIFRAGSVVHRFHSVNPSLSGEPSFGNGLGNSTTIRGGNGYSATGRAILDFGGSYPASFDSRLNRWSYYGETDYRISESASIAAGVQGESEYGAGGGASTNRNNVGTFFEGGAHLFRRLHLNAGIGIEHNAVFGDAASPRASAAAYLRNPATGLVGDTRLTFNFGKGIKEPDIFQELSSLYTVLRDAPGGSVLISRFNVSPIAPPRSRNMDIGLEQGLWSGRARLRLAYFHNHFLDQIEFVSKDVLPELGIPVEAAAASLFGAYVNSSSYRAQGVEIGGEAQMGRGLRFQGSYTFLDAVVEKSLSGNALAPAFNPAIPGVPIGAFSPLVGGRPFRQPAHAANAVAVYNAGRFQFSISGYFAGKSDDSTFLLDENFGNSLLLPNHDLNAGYQKVDVGGSYRIGSHLKWYAGIDNVLNEHYEPAFGFPALSRAFRTGFTVRAGGGR